MHIATVDYYLPINIQEVKVVPKLRFKRENTNMFPFHVKFSRDIELVNIEKQNPQNILVFLEKRLSNKNADNIYKS